MTPKTGCVVNRGRSHSYAEPPAPAEEAPLKIIKGVLEEELKKAVQAEKEFAKALAGLPRGVLVKKYVKGASIAILCPVKKGKFGSNIRVNCSAKILNIMTRLRKIGRGIGCCFRK